MEFRSASASVVSTGMVMRCVFGLAPAAGSGRGAVGSEGMLLSKDAIADVLERLRPRCESKLRTIGRTYGHFRLTRRDTVDDIRSYV
jgi:hypothetical protein